MVLIVLGQAVVMVGIHLNSSHLRGSCPKGCCLQGSTLVPEVIVPSWFVVLTPSASNIGL